ncbi:MAG: MarR family winged helix-turn-helix transcriptional regulator [Phycisphaerae bacterium]
MARAFSPIADDCERRKPFDGRVTRVGGGGGRKSAVRADISRRAPSADAARRLMRWCHIFSAAVRETLETDLVREVCAQPLTLAQFHLLELIARNGQHQAGEVAGFLGVSAPAATKNIDKLVRQGLLIRRPAADDRRALSLQVSAKGRELVRRYNHLKRIRVAQVLRGLHPADARRLAELLERFSLALFSATRVVNGLCLRCAAYVEPECAMGKLQGGCPYQRLRRPPPIRNGKGRAHAPHT